MKTTSPIQRAEKALSTRRFAFFSLLAATAIFFGLSTETSIAQTQTRTFPITNGSGAFDIARGSDGNFWFTLSNSNKVARVTPNGRITYFRTPSLSNPAFITAGPDGNLWFGEGSTGAIAFVTPAGQVKEIQFSFFGVSVGVTTGSDGNIWFSDQTDHAIWRFDLSNRTFTEFKTPTPNSFPGDMTLGSDGNVWFVEGAVDQFARITPDGQITEFSGVSSPGSIAAGPDGNIWIASSFTATISRVTPSIEITSFPTPHTPSIIRPGNRDNLLFSSFTGNTIASITTDGVVTESAEFVHSAPLGIAAGDKAQVWFLGSGTNRVYETIFEQ
jgi:virginiamycin B lyase